MSTRRSPASAPATNGSSSCPVAHRVWIRVDYYPDRSQQGHVRGFLVTYTDVDNLKRLELEAGQREHRLRLVTDSVGLPILLLRPAAQAALRQQAVRRLDRRAGRRPARPRAVAISCPPTRSTEMQGYIERAFAGATVSYERRERRATGELRWVRVTLFPDREIGGRVGGAFVVMNDIEDDVRDPRRAEVAGSRSSGCSPTTSRARSPISTAACTYTFVNQAFANWVCQPQDEIYGKTPFEVMASDVASFLRPILKRAQVGEHVEYERIGKNANGQRRWMHGRIAPDLDVDRQGARPLLHRIRHPRPQARPSRRWPRARSSCACSPTTSRSRSSTSTPTAATCSSTRRSCELYGLEPRRGHRQDARGGARAPGLAGAGAGPRPAR